MVSVDSLGSSLPALVAATWCSCWVEASVPVRVWRSASRNSPHAVASCSFFSRHAAWLSSVAIVGSSFWLASNAAQYA